MKTRTALLLAFLPCAACAAVPDETPRDVGLEMPTEFTAEETPDGSPPDLWWRTFDDPALTAVVEEAIVNNRDLGTSIARVDAALASAEVAGADLWPHVSAGANLERRRLNFIGLPIPGGGDVFSVTTNQFALSLDLSWEIDLWGRVRAGQVAANSDVEAAVADLRGARLSIAARAAKAWFACIEAGQQLRLAEETAASFRRTEEQVVRRFEAGVRPALDVRLARADREAAEALVDQRRREHDRALRQLQILLGRYPDAALEPSAELPGMPEPVPAGLPSELLQRRPDLVAAERRLAAADARLAQSRADLYPRISLTASGGTSSNDLEDLADFDFRVWSLGANILAPIFEGGRRRATVSLRDAQVREALSGFSSAVLRALSEVETALAAEQFYTREEQRRAAAADESEAAFRLSEDRYGRGLVDINTLLTAQRRAVGARTLHLAVRRQRLDTRIDLLLALGGGFEEATATDEGGDRP